MIPTAQTTVADAVGATLAGAGVDTVFTVLGSGNLVVTNALAAGGARLVTARHEGGAICMADGFARVSGRVGVCTVHQGPGLTNAMTGLAEAAKSRTPVLVLAADTPAAAIHSNFRIDQHGLVASVGAVAERVHGPATARADALRALRRAALEQRPVVLMLPLDVQAAPAPPTTADPSSQEEERSAVVELPAPPAPAAAAVARAAALLAAARRPVIVAGRGAVLSEAGAALAALGERCGALLATSAPANGLFAGEPFALGIAGGFSTPLAAELLPQADLVVAFGATLNHWTTRHGSLFGDADTIQVDLDPTVLGAQRPATVAIVGDARATAEALARAIERGSGWRTDEIRAQVASRSWSREPLDAALATGPSAPPPTPPSLPAVGSATTAALADSSAAAAGSDAAAAERIDPRTLTIALERALPAAKTVAVDSGHFLGWPAMYLTVPDARAWVFPNGFQAVGLGLGNAIGAAVARPDRPTVAAIGDGGAFMALPEIETAVRERLRLLVVVYDDAAYGAEVHHFGPHGHDLAGVRFPDADLAAIARGAGAEAIAVRAEDDLHAVERWAREQAPRPLVLDAKIDPTICAAWLEDAFRAG